MNYFFRALTCVLLASCGPDHPGETKTGLASHVLHISDNEDKGIKDVISCFGGECEYGFSKKTGINTESGQAFWLSLRKSDALERVPVDAEGLASGIALVFYRHLKEEKTKYTHIDVKVTKSGVTAEQSFSVHLLDSALNRFKIVESTLNLIDKEDYKRLANDVKLDERFYEALNFREKASFVDTVKAIRTASGPLKEFFPVAFRKFTVPGAGDFFYFSNFVFFQQRNYPISIIVNSDTSDSKAHFFNYNF